MSADDPAKGLVEAQRRWAQARGISTDAQGRTLDLEHNLFRPLRPETRAEFARGAGCELGGPDAPGSLQSLRSSAALVCNVFDYWRGRDLAPIAAACGADPRATGVSFERRYPTGLTGMPPHLDVVLDGEGTLPTAIESKFTECYHPPDNQMVDSYFESPQLWDQLPRCHKIARELRAEPRRWKSLGVAQLLKHALGLTRAYGRTGFQLLYLWFEVEGGSAAQHRVELQRLRERLGSEIKFSFLSYPVLIERLAGLEAEHAE